MRVAFIFDLDGVITDTASIHFTAWQETVQKIGIDLDPKLNDQLKGLSRMDSLLKILESYHMDSSISTTARLRLVEEKNNLYRRLISTLTPNAILPGVKSVLQIIHEQGFPLGLASASHNAPRILELLKLDHLFHTVADPAKVTFGKPAPDIFLLAARMLHVEPKTCIGIEDARSGVAAIKAAGMFAVGVGDDNELKNADWVVPTTAKLTLPDMLHHFKNAR